MVYLPPPPPIPDTLPPEAISDWTAYIIIGIIILIFVVMRIRKKIKGDEW